jgi:septum formation protein
MARFVLASQSPRRRELLKLCGYSFDTVVAGVNENSVSHPDPAQNCIRTAQLKARAILDLFAVPRAERTIVIAADTTVALDGQMLGKPTDKEDAHHMLVALRDRTHEVHTGVVLLDLDSGRELLGSHTAVVTMRPYNDQEIIDYVATGDPLDKAGAYAIQNHKFKPVSRLDGCYLGVMGLSVCHLLQLLDQLDLPFLTSMAALNVAHQQYPCPVYDKLARKLGKYGGEIATDVS